MKAKLFAALVLLPGIAAGGQNPPAVPNPQTNTITVGSQGSSEAAPDTAVVQFNLAVQEDTSGAAFQDASQAAEHLRNVLRQNGIEPKSADIGYYSLQPVIDYKNPKHKVVAYRVTSAVTVKLKDFAKVGPLTAGLSEIQETQGESVSYTLENMETARQKAVADAFGKARGLAETLARSGGKTLGELEYATIDVSQPGGIRPMFARAMAATADAVPAPTEGFTEQTIRVTADVRAVFGLK